MTNLTTTATTISPRHAMAAAFARQFHAIRVLENLIDSEALAHAAQLVGIRLCAYCGTHEEVGILHAPDGDVPCCFECIW